MKKCIIIPDSFKGTLTATEVCEIICDKIKKVFPTSEVVAVPVADGGEGTVDSFLYALGCEKVWVESTNPFGEKNEVYYARQNSTAIIEMAMCAGLPQVEGRKNPSITTTFGVGSMIKHALDNGCTDILLGLGGSCTNDGGTGMAAALGVEFFNDLGKAFVPTGSTLKDITRIDISNLHPRVRESRITAMCDVNNPMYGPSGAACVFSPQKGADTSMVEVLDAGLRHLDQHIQKDLGVNVAEIPGAGAAGAVGAGVFAFLGGKLIPGIEAVLELVHYDEMLIGADLVFTGEGCIDSQSLRGKVIAGVASHAKKFGIPVVVVAGMIGEGATDAYDLGVSAIFSINREAEAFETSRFKSRENLASTAEDILRLWKAKPT